MHEIRSRVLLKINCDGGSASERGGASRSGGNRRQWHPTDVESGLGCMQVELLKMIDHR